MTNIELVKTQNGVGKTCFTINSNKIRNKNIFHIELF